ncbi:MAG TPA: hypothetical protein VK858_15640, partial [Longimicrobiales bacterium]|nr:hypothetical protein [Longimicrobiales bacterium]
DGEGSFGPDRIDVAASGDLAIERGTWRSPGAEGRYMTLYLKEGNQWRVHADVSLDATPDGGAPVWATTQLATWYDLYNARDAQGLAGLYAADAVVGGLD